MSTNSTLPASEALDTETEETVLERLKTLERDKKDAQSWAEVKARILEAPGPK